MSQRNSPPNAAGVPFEAQDPRFADYRDNRKISESSQSSADSNKATMNQDPKGGDKDANKNIGEKKKPGAGAGLIAGIEVADNQGNQNAQGNQPKKNERAKKQGADRTRRDSLESLMDGFQRMRVNFNPRGRTMTRNWLSSPGIGPTYVPETEQALLTHKKSVVEANQKADMMTKMVQLLVETRLNQDEEISPEFRNTVTDLYDEIEETRKEANAKEEGLRRATRIVDYYQTPIQKPDFYVPYPDERPTRVNLKELIMVTGYFDPSEKDADFKHVWNKLLDYGMAERYEEHHYITALGAVLKKQAYETFCDLRQTRRSLYEILEYFAKVYAKKRSLLDDRNAVDQFTRHKNESIMVCMDRCIIAIDKLRHHYPESAWPQIRQQMRRQILMQVVKEETRTHIQIKEDEVTEETGLSMDFEALIKAADRYERHYKHVPEKDIQTLFKVASGGIVSKAQDNIKQQEQLQHLKKEQMLEKRLQTLQAQVEQLVDINNIGLQDYKNRGRTAEGRREARKEGTEQIRRASRDASRNRNRDLSMDAGMDVTQIPLPPDRPRPSAPPPPPAEPTRTFQRQRPVTPEMLRSPAPPPPPTPPPRQQRSGYIGQTRSGTPGRQNPYNSPQYRPQSAERIPRMDNWWNSGVQKFQMDQKREQEENLRRWEEEQKKRQQQNYQQKYQEAKQAAQQNTGQQWSFQPLQRNQSSSPYRGNPGNRYQSKSPGRSATPSGNPMSYGQRSGSNPYARNQSSDNSNKRLETRVYTDGIDKVYINIGGREFIGRPRNLEN